MNRQLPPRYVILVLNDIDPELDIGKTTSAYAHLHFDKNGKIGLEGVALKMWDAASSLRSMMLLGLGIETVVVCRDLTPDNVAFVESLKDKRLWFENHKDWHHLASYESWVAPVDLFMRLATIQKTLPNLKEVIDISRLIEPSNADRLYWTTWLSNHHVNYQSEW